MQHSPATLMPADLADAILAGTARAADAMGRPVVFDYLQTQNGPALLGTSSKIDAAGSVGVLSRVLYMQPAMESGREACASRSDGCTAACLAEGTGRMSMTASQRARRRRHAMFYADRNRFMVALHREVAAHERSANKRGKIAAVRLNGTTDLPWHRISYILPDGTRVARIHDAFPGVRFYEYTKHTIASYSRGAGIPSNLHVTFSVSERLDAETVATGWLNRGYGAAVVAKVAKHAGPDTFTIGTTVYPTVDGDVHDARFLDPAGSVVILAAKGRAKTDTTGFVRAI